MYRQWKLSGWLVWDLGRLELTVSRGQFGRLRRQRKVSKQARMQVSKLIYVGLTGNTECDV